MLRHNLLLFYRNLKRFKNAFLINLVGLATGLACFLFCRGRFGSRADCLIDSELAGNSGRGG